MLRPLFQPYGKLGLISVSSCFAGHPSAAEPAFQLCALLCRCLEMWMRRCCGPCSSRTARSSTSASCARSAASLQVRAASMCARAWVRSCSRTQVCTGSAHTHPAQPVCRCKQQPLCVHTHGSGPAAAAICVHMLWSQAAAVAGSPRSGSPLRLGVIAALLAGSLADRRVGQCHRPQLSMYRAQAAPLCSPADGLSLRPLFKACARQASDSSACSACGLRLGAVQQVGRSRRRKRRAQWQDVAAGCASSVRDIEYTRLPSPCGRQASGANRAVHAGCAFVQYSKWAEAGDAIDVHNRKTRLPMRVQAL